MKLIIREYLSLLKESKELDRMLPDLLLMMDIEPFSYAQVGVRQYGVDVAATEKKTGSTNKLLLFTIKQGDIGRTDWDTNEQSVRQSLEEIKDVYLESHIRPEHKNYAKKIILCTGGILKQEIEQNWKGYISKNTIEGEIEYEFWGGDKLSLLIEKFMFNEQVVPIQYRSSFRKVLSLLSDSDYDLYDYYHILNGMLLEADFGDISKTNSLKKAKKVLRTIHLLLNIIFYWAESENNLKPALKAAERTILITWEFIRKNNLYSKKKITEICLDIYKSFFNIYSKYFTKIQKYCFVQNGFHGYSRSAILENLNVFEQLGILSTTGILFFHQAASSNRDDIIRGTNAISSTLMNYIRNHQSINSPFYDDHIIEISATIFFLACCSEIDFIDQWIKEIINNIAYAYNSMGKYFPIQSDSFEDIIALSISGEKNKEELSELSTLLPILAQWCAALNFVESYALLTDITKKVFKHTTYQIWYPDSETDKYLYTCNAAYKSGVVDAPLIIPDDIKEMKNMVVSVNKKIIIFDDFSSVKFGLHILPVISSRHYRTPFLPYYWQQMIIGQDPEKNDF